MDSALVFTHRLLRIGYWLLRIDHCVLTIAHWVLRIDHCALLLGSFNPNPHILHARQLLHAHGLFDFDVIFPGNRKPHALSEEELAIVNITLAGTNPGTIGIRQWKLNGVDAFFPIGKIDMGKNVKITERIIVSVAYVEIEIVFRNGIRNFEVERQTLIHIPNPIRNLAVLFVDAIRITSRKNKKRCDEYGDDNSHTY